MCECVGVRCNQVYVRRRDARREARRMARRAARFGIKAPRRRRGCFFLAMECTKFVLAFACWAAAASATQAQLLQAATPAAAVAQPTPSAAQPQAPQTALPQQQPLQPQQQQPLQPQQRPYQPQLFQQPLPQLSLPLPLSPQNSVLLQCRQTVPSTDLDIAEIQRQILPVSYAGQCLLACAAQRLGYMQPNFPLETQGAGALMNTLFPSRGFDPTFQNSLLATVNQCLVQADPLAQVAYSGQTALNLFNTARQFNPIPGLLG